MRIYVLDGAGTHGRHDNSLTSSPRLKPGDSWTSRPGRSCFIDGCLPALGAGRSHTISAG